MRTSAWSNAWRALAVTAMVLGCDPFPRVNPLDPQCDRGYAACKELGGDAGGTTDAGPPDSATGPVRLSPGGCLDLTCDGNALALDDTAIYWMSQSTAGVGGFTVYRMRRSGGVPTAIMDGTGRPGPTALAVDSSRIYWGNAGIYSSAKDGSDVTKLTGDRQILNARGIAVDGSDVFWTERNPGNIVRVPRGGGESVVAASSVAGVLSASLALDATAVFWLDCAGNPGALRKLTKEDGAITTAAPVAHCDGDIAIDGTTVFWSDSTTGEVSAVPRTGGTAVTIYKGPPGKFASLAVDAAEIYVGGPDLVRVPKSGGSSEILASRANAADVALDDKAVYWLSADGLWSLPK